MNIIAKNLLTIITLALLAVNGLLIFQNLKLKAQLDELSPKEIKAGNRLAPFIAKDLNGNRFAVNYNDGNAKRVLLYFHPTCGFCKKQMPYWRELVSKADPAKYKIDLITTETDTDSIKKYLDTYNINSWETFSIKKEDADKAELSGTPITVVLDDNGKVEKVWIGMWRDKEIADAGNYFSIDFNKVKAGISQ